jgi:very-long-chain ceramide synthase
MATKVIHTPVGLAQPRQHVEIQKVEKRKLVVARKQESPKRTKKNENESLAGSFCSLICNHQIGSYCPLQASLLDPRLCGGTICLTSLTSATGIAINLVLLLFLTHTFFPRARRRTTKFLHLSYYNPETGLYGCGTDDIPVVALWVVILTGLRAVVMDYLLDPLARLGGVKTKKGLARFKEQGWLIVYYTGSWFLGMVSRQTALSYLRTRTSANEQQYIMYHSDFWLNLNGMWVDWPHREINGLFKWYYLVQWASYLQQNLSVNIEEKRKDYAQMFTHHIFTCALIAFSYGYYHMRVGTMILCIMDLVDIILPVSYPFPYGLNPANITRLPNCSSTLVSRQHATLRLVCS